MSASNQKATSPLAFDRYSAAKKLKELAKHPIDFTKENTLTPERLNRFCATSLGYKLLYGTERVTDEVMSSLIQLAEESSAVEKMQEMQSGKIMNFIEGFPSEQRPVLHTAARDFFSEPNRGKMALEAAQLCRGEADRLKSFIAELDKKGSEFTDLIMVGIGGSDLGPRAHYLALQSLRRPHRNVHFISNVDPDDVASTLKDLDLKHCLVGVVSKSGTTLETHVNEEFLRSRFQKAGLKPEKHFIAITGKGSPMDDPKRYLECFHIWDWIGGRFSTTSMVGGLMLSFAYGFEVYWDLLKGANAMDKAALHSDISHNLPLLSALLGIWNHNFLGYPTLAIIPYSQGLLRWSAHIQQVDMESNGKQIDRQGRLVDFETGPIIWGEAGTNAQHSFFQLIHQGTATIPVEFIGFKYSQFKEDFEFNGTSSQQKLLANLFAQALALAVGKQDPNPNQCFPGNRPSHILLAEQLTPYALGALLSYFEHKIAFQGFIWNINSFDQEGVQLGKVLANRIIQRFEKKGDSYPLGDALLNQLDSF